MSQSDNPEKNEKKTKREKKNKEDTKYNKSEKEKQILDELINEWSHEGYRSPNKEKICLKYLKILEENNFTNYSLQEIKEYCNNHRKRPAKSKEMQQGALNIPTSQQPQLFQQQIPQTLQNSSIQIYNQQPINQIYYKTVAFQQQNIIQPPSQEFSQQNSLTQLPYQVYPQQSQQLSINQGYSNQQLPQQFHTNQPQQQFQFNQTYPQQQINQSIPQQIMQPPNNEPYSQQPLLQTSINQEHPNQQSFIQTLNQSYSQQQLQPLSGQANTQQQSLQPQPNPTNSIQQILQPLSNQAYSQKQPQQLVSNQIIPQQEFSNQPNQILSQQQNQSQENQQPPIQSINQQEQLQQQSSQPQLAQQNPVSFSNNPLSPEMSTIVLPSDFPLFSSENSQFTSRTNSESSDSNTAASQLQISSAQLVQQKLENTELNQSQILNNEAIATERAKAENESLNSDNKIENQGQNENENNYSISTKIQNVNNNHNNGDNEKFIDDESDSENNGNGDTDESYNIDDDDDDDDGDKSEPKKDTDIDIKKRIVLTGPHGGKQVGKSYYFPSDTVYTSYSSSSTSPLTVSLPCKLQSSIEKINNNDDLIQLLPDMILPQKELNAKTLDSNKIEIYKSIKNCYRYIHKAATIYHQEPNPDGKIIFNQKYFDFQKEVEIRLISFINFLTDNLNVGQIGSHDQFCDHVDIKNKKNILSRTTRLYNGDSLSDSGPPSRTSSQGNSDSNVSLKSSVDKITRKVKFEDGANNSNTNNTNEIGMADCIVSSYISNIKRFKVNEKLSSFYLGRFNDETRYSIDITDAEVADIISYTYKPETNSEDGKDNDIIVCEYAYVNYSFNSHVLYLKGAKCETGFYGPVQSMYFHRSNNINKIYLCGDVRVKEFLINGLDGDQNVTIENTNTFYFGVKEYQSAAITVWGEELVLAVNSRILFWNINNDSSLRKNKESLDTDANVELVKHIGIDESKIDWTHGKYSKSNTIKITASGMQQITSLAVIGNTDKESYLAVSSINYPVIYIYNKQHQNISRLVSHTMGITCIKSLGYNLFSGSIDLIARMWDVYNGEPIFWCNTRCEKIYSIEPSFYCGKMILFTGGKDNAIQCFSITDKKALFEIKLNKNLVPKKISFITGNNETSGDHAKLMIISECFSQNNPKNYQVHYFEFI